MQNIIIHCQPSLLETVQQLNLTYNDYHDEVDVILPYTKEVEDVNNKYIDEAEFVNHFGLDYNQINCIELI